MISKNQTPLILDVRLDSQFKLLNLGDRSSKWWHRLRGGKSRCIHSHVFGDDACNRMRTNVVALPYENESYDVVAVVGAFGSSDVTGDRILSEAKRVSSRFVLVIEKMYASWVEKINRKFYENKDEKITINTRERLGDVFRSSALSLVGEYILSGTVLQETIFVLEKRGGLHD